MPVGVSEPYRKRGEGGKRGGRDEGGEGEKGGEGTNQVPVSSVQQVFAAATWSAGPPATQAMEVARGMRDAVTARRRVCVCILMV